METKEKLSTKKELAQKRKHPICPVRVKGKKNQRMRHVETKLTPLGFYNNVTLSPMYDPQQELPYLDQVFSRLGCIGEGSFGRVYRVRSKEDQQLYAIKRLKAGISIKDRYAEVRNNEVIGFSPHCVQYYMAWEENSETFMLLEYCDMSLADYSKLDNNIPEELLWNVLFDISKALEFLHKKHFLHLDVKPGNIMIQKGLFKLGDFGLLVNLQKCDRVCKSTLSDGDSKYLALEVLDGIYTSACDIFGLGLSILELATDIELPDHGILWHQLRNSCLPVWFYDRITGGLSVIVEKMVSSDYKQRPSAEEILSYSTLKDIAIRDSEVPRSDFAGKFNKWNDMNDNLPLSPIQFNENNNNTCTPPYNTTAVFDDHDDSNYSLLREPHNSTKFKGRKSLFSKTNDLASSSGYSSSSSLGMVNSNPDNSFLAQSLSGSGMTYENDEARSLNVLNKDNTNPFGMSSLITSTPILKAKHVKRLPKTRLSFD